jgi:hypothetical protein
MFFKLDESIKKAQKAFASGDFQKARDLYETAYQDNPTHGYLKNRLTTVLL